MVSFGKYYRNHNNKHKRIKKALTTLIEKYEAQEYELLLAQLMNHPAQLHPVIGTTNEERIKKSVSTVEIQIGKIDCFSLLVTGQGHNT